MSEDRGGPRVGIFGSSFNPPHVSHVFTVAWGLSACGLDEVWLVPVWRHAFGKDLAPFPDRVAMCERAFAIFGARVRVSTVERELGEASGGRSYTIDTVRHLRAAWPERRFALLMGSDAWHERDRWKEFDALGRLAPIHVIGRTGVPDPADRDVGPSLPAVSSTDIRARLRRGAAVSGIVPDAVVAYVRERGLYRTGS